MMPTEALLGSTNWLLGYVAYGRALKVNIRVERLQVLQGIPESVLNNFTNYQLPVLNLARKHQRKPSAPYSKRLTGRRKPERL